VKVKHAIADLIEFGESNHIEKVLRKRDLLRRFASSYGARDVKDISVTDIGRFLKNASARSKIGRSPARWEERYADRFGSGKAAPFPWEHSRPLGELAALFKRKTFRPERVLELGCGDGTESIFMAEKGCHVTAVDISKTVIRVARQRAKEAGVSCRFIAADLFDLKLPRGSVDFVFDRGCFHHLSVAKYAEYIDIVENVLGPKGKFLLVAHSPKMFLGSAEDLYLGMYARAIRLICSGVTQSGFSRAEIDCMFGGKFVIQANKIILDDDRSRDYEFVCAFMEKRARR
jgi:SAM-dependent methyltransferase